MAENNSINSSIIDTSIHKETSSLSEELATCLQTVEACMRDSAKDISGKSLMQSIAFLYDRLKLNSLLPIASIMLRLHGKPYNVSESFFPMEPMFSLRISPKTLWKTGRQVSKSTSAAARLLLRSSLLPYHSILSVTPRAEQMRRFSSNYINPFLLTSPFKQLSQGARLKTNTVSQKSLPNQSILFFSFAFLSCDRIRGISCREVVIDECQDLDFEYLPVIKECMSASPLGPIELYCGTPRSLINTIEALWMSSSQAEWITPCPCGQENIPTVAEGVMDMIQPKGLSCKKCDRLLQPRNGRWEHTVGDKSNSFAGYHLPQIIMPMHYENPIKWRDIIYKKNNIHPATFMNEVLGESCDTGLHLLSPNQLRDACCLDWKNDYKEALEHRQEYYHVIMGVDWGGHGRDMTSFTAVALMGYTASGEIHCLYGERLLSAMTEIDEIKRIIELYRSFHCQFLAHDYGGSGSLREIMVIQSGLEQECVMPIQWVSSAAQDLVTFKATKKTTRAYYSVDKTRALSIAIAMIKAGLMKFPKYEDGVLFEDWLSLIEEKYETPYKSDYYLIRRNPARSDDFAHACAFASVCLWHTLDAYPDLAASFRQEILE